MSTAKFDRMALEAMLVSLRPRLHRYAARMAGSTVEGEDIVQEAVVKALAAHDGG
ncbi:RNA polymerase sigma factor, partial [Mesorhizobium sp. M8A.F.Ca.ET.182.01.1.1]